MNEIISRVCHPALRFLHLNMKLGLRYRILKYHTGIFVGELLEISDGSRYGHFKVISVESGGLATGQVVEISELAEFHAVEQIALPITRDDGDQGRSPDGSAA